MMLCDFEQYDIEEMCVSLGKNKKLLDELVDKLREWLKLQPHLPQESVLSHVETDEEDIQFFLFVQGAENERLEWFLLGTKLSLEQAKQKLDTYYTIRGLIPELFSKRDPCAQYMINLHEVMQYVFLPKLTPEKYRTYIIRFRSGDTILTSIEVVYRYLFMINEIRMVEDRSSGDRLIFDLSMMSTAQLLAMTPTFLKKLEVSASAHAVRLKGIHILNAFSLVNSVVTMAKSILKPKLAARIHVHANGNFETLHQFVPKSILPKEYGGTYSNMDELNVLLRKKVETWRDWYLEQEKVLVDESLRPGPVVNEDSLFGFSGSFRKLDVD